MGWWCSAKYRRRNGLQQQQQREQEDHHGVWGMHRTACQEHGRTAANNHDERRRVGQ